MDRPSRPPKWLSEEEQRELYLFFGPLTEIEMRNLKKKSHSYRSMTIQDIYGRQAARYARKVYQEWLRKNS